MTGVGTPCLFFLPPGEAAAVRQSGLDSHLRQYPAVDDVPDGKDADKDKYVSHGVLFQR